MAYTIKSLGYGQVAVLQNGKHVKKFGGASAATDARMFINKQHQASLPKERAPGLKEHELAKELEGINNNIGSFTEDMLEQFEVSEINAMIENYQSFEKTVAILEEKGTKSSKAMAAFIGRKKYSGKKCDEAVQIESIVENAQFDLNEGLAVHGKYSIKTGPVVGGMGEGAPDHVKAHIGKLNKIGVKADAKPGDYGTTHRVVVKNNETGDTTHHHVYQRDKDGKKPIMSIRTVGKPRANQDEHHQVLKDYLTGKKPKTETVKESAEDLEEAIKGWKHAHSDIAKARSAAAAANNNVKLVRLKKDGKESGMHDAIKTFKSEDEARKHHANMVKLNPGKGISHNLYIGSEHKDVLKEEYIEEKLTEKDPSSKWIEDFVKSDNPKFAGKSKKERIKMALGAYYGKQNEELDALAEEIAGLFEDSEQLDELKKSTLASYIKKSAVELPAHQTNATLKHTGPIANAHSGKHPKTGESPVQWDDRKVRNRQQGIIRGASKLARESFADQFFDGEIIREEIQLPNLQEADKNYDAYFKACMKNAGITSISDLKTPEEKKEFMNKVDAGFKAKNEDMFYENFMRSDIDAKVADHEKSGNKVADVTHKIYQGKPYAEFTVTTPDGAKKKYIFHGNVTRHEKLA